MQITIKYSGKEFKIPINQNEEGASGNDGGALKIPKTLGELRECIADETGCELSTMKLLWRGKYIVMPLEEPIENIKFKSSDKIMVIGVSKRDAGLQLLLAYEKNHLTKLCAIFKEIEQDLTELEKNFLEGDILKEMLTKMEKRINGFTEKSLQHLESIDALQIYNNEQITEEQKQRNREKRKCMVDGVQALLRENDKFAFRLEQYRKSLEFPDL